MDQKNIISIIHNELQLQIKKDVPVKLMKLGFAGEPNGEFAADERAYALTQVHLAGGDRDAHHGGKHIFASESTRAVFIGCSTEDLSDGTLYRVVSETDRVRITTNFRFWNGIHAVRIWNEVENIGKEEIVLEEVSAVNLYDFFSGGKKTAYEKTNFYLPTNSWHVECQWQKYSLRELGIFDGNGGIGSGSSLKRMKVTNSGTWSTKEYLPMGMLEDEESGTFLLWQIENNGSWHYEIGDHDHRLYLNLGGPNYAENGWAKLLRPGERFVGVPACVALGKSLNDVFGQITKYRRKIRRNNRDNIEIPAIYNSYMHFLWDYPTEESLIPIIDRVAETGCEYFCIDAGWHDEDDWWKKLGGWEQSRTRFPNGVKPVIDYIHQKGMKAGLWVEIECMGVECPWIGKLPPEAFFCRNGRPVTEHNRRMLDFRHPLVCRRADEVIDQMMAYGIDYIKMDYNIDAGNGTECNAYSAGDGLLDANRAFLTWLQSVLERYPNLTIENCASGGCRMDYAMLSLLSIQSTSDQIDYLKYPYIAANAATALTPEQAAVWSYPLADGVKAIDLDDEVIVFNMVNSLLGRIHLASDLTKLSPPQLALVKEGIDLYRETRPFKIRALPYYPCGLSSFGNETVVSGLTDGKEVYLAVWNLGEPQTVCIPLNGLEVIAAEIIYPRAKPIALRLERGNLYADFDKKNQARFIRLKIRE